MTYVAAIEVDKRQRIIVAADKMKEMLGGSWTIAETKKLADRLAPTGSNVTQIKVASGDIWLRAETLEELEACLWKFRQEIVGTFGLSCSFAIVEENGSLTNVRNALSGSMDKVKREKSGEVGHLSLPWFAPCQIQPSESANHWIPDWDGHEQHKRRALICESSYKRLERGFKTLKEYYGRFTEPGGEYKRTDLNYPNSLNDFASSGDGSYLALLRFDADQSGKFFENIDLSETEPSAPWLPLRNCSDAFGYCLEAALQTAFEETIKPLKFKSNDKIPISPLIAEGEDFLIVLRKDLALPFTSHLLKAYSDLTSNNFALKQAAVGLSGFAFTLSGAVVFARSGFPFSVLSEMSVALEHSAKKLREGLAEKQSCLDVYWLESTAREDPIAARRTSLIYEIAGKSYSLNTRPWTLKETTAMWNAATQLKVPRGKRHQLLAGLWSGEPLASFHFQRWMQHLSDAQRKSVLDAAKTLEDAGLWKTDTGPWFKRKLDDKDYLCSPFLELHELCEMGAGGEDEDGEREQA
jgi:hypothetical protein